MKSFKIFVSIITFAFTTCSFGMDLPLSSRIFFVHLSDVMPIPKLVIGGLNAGVPITIFTKVDGKIIDSSTNPESLSSPPLRPTIHWAALGARANCCVARFLGDTKIETNQANLCARQYGILESAQNLQENALFGGEPADTFSIGDYKPSSEAIIFAPAYKRQEITQLLATEKNPLTVIYYEYSDSFGASDAIMQFAHERALLLVDNVYQLNSDYIIVFQDQSTISYQQLFPDNYIGPHFESLLGQAEFAFREKIISDNLDKVSLIVLTDIIFQIIESQLNHGNNAYLHNSKIINAIFSWKEKLLDYSGYNKDTMLIAVRNGRLALFNMVINKMGNDGQYMADPSYNENLALLVAANNGHSDIVRALLNARDHHGRLRINAAINGLLAIKVTIYFGDIPEIISLLLDARQDDGALSIDISSSGSDLLEFSKKFCRNNTTKLLLEARDDDGNFRIEGCGLPKLPTHFSLQ